MKVKICGITNLADARAATDFGADFLGFIFYPPSKRGTTIEAAKSIAGELRSQAHCPLLIGVFVDEPPAKVAEILDICALDLAQLSGREVPSMIGSPQSPLYGRSFKVLHPGSLAEAEAELEWYVPPQPLAGQPTIMIDTPHSTLPGGTGQTGEWPVSAALASRQPGLMLAGGLNPQNIRRAIDTVHPFAVDVASGVEKQPGIKDHRLVEAFIRRAKEA